MKDKYYTPDLTEFRIGFRYEFKVFGTEEWRQFKFLIGDEFENLYNFEQELNRCRVKYLCEEDILNLGFIKLTEYSYSTEYVINNCYLQLWSNGDVLIWTKGNMNTLFSGQVKNINELEVILKQVGI